MAKVKTKRWDAADYIVTPEDVLAALQAAFDEAADLDDPRVVAHMLGVIARSKGMSEIAKKTGLSRETLYKTLSDSGNPTLATLMGVTKALGLKLTAVAA
jgi:probable addiction module antidote protein